MVAYVITTSHSTLTASHSLPHTHPCCATSTGGSVWNVDGEEKCQDLDSSPSPATNFAPSVCIAIRPLIVCS